MIGDEGPAPEVTLRELAGDPPVEFPPRKTLVLMGRVSLANRGTYDPEAAVPAEVDEMLMEGVSDSMRDATEHWWGHWIKWCGRTGRHHLPVIDHPEHVVATMRFYIWSFWVATGKDGKGAGRRGRPYAPATVRNAVYCVSTAMQWLGHASPTRHPSIRAQLKGYAVRWSKAGHKPDKSHPISLEENVRMARACDLTTVQGLRAATMVRLQHDMGARESEMLGLNLDDLSWIRTGDAPVIRIWIGRSKNDQVGTGRTLYVEAVPDVDGDVDPALLLTRYVRARRDQGATEGPLFVHVNGAVPRTDGELSGTFGVERVTRRRYEQIHGDLTRAAGIDKDPETGAERRVTTHGERGGHITGARNAGLLAEQVAGRTGHSKGSNTIHEYWDGGDQLGAQNSGTAVRLARRPAVPDPRQQVVDSDGAHS